MGMNRILAGIVMTLLLLLALALPAQASDYTLEIFGNANEDETINMQDVTYTELIILEYRDETELSDAKHDGKINMQDVTQIELVILGKEKEMTLLDTAGNTVTVKKPVERVVVLNHYAGRLIRSLGAKDRIVGIMLTFAVEPYCHFWPDLKDVPVVSGHMARQPDYEAIMELEPDVLFSFVGSGDPEGLVEKLEPAGIRVVLLDCSHTETYPEETRKLGYILDKRETAEEYLEFRQSIFDLVEERVEGLEPDEKKTVYYEFMRAYRTNGGGSRIDAVIQKSGGINVFGDIYQHSFEVDPEELLERDPDVVFKDMHTTPGYPMTDTSTLEEAREEMLSRPGWDELTAVKNDEVYVGSREAFVWIGGAMGVCHISKWLYPDLFEDLNPETFRKEYMEDWQGVPYQGVYTYPEPS